MKRALSIPRPEAGPAIPIQRYSTADVPPADRRRHWEQRTWTRPPYRTVPVEPFHSRWERARLGPLLFVYSEITGMRWERRVQDVRESDVHPIILSLMIEGRAQGDLDGRAFLETAGAFHFHDLARPSLHVSTASRTYALVIPRPVAAESFGPLDDLHGLVVGPEAAAMLFSHADQVRQALPRFGLGEAERLGRVFLDLAALALAQVRPAARAPVAAEDALRRRAVERIDRHLGGGRLGVADLCRALGVSRRRLFDAFRPDGGVQTYITAQRLARARAALADIERAEPVGTIAHRLGFSDAPHLSRAFRQRYGMTPRDYRRLVAESRNRDGDGLSPPPSAPAG